MPRERPVWTDEGRATFKGRGATPPPGSAPLEPDRDQIEIFVDAMFRHASPAGIVSLRSFHEDNPKPFRITAAALSGGHKFLIEAAEDDARRAANFPKPIVFCPPLATFSNKAGAEEKDIAEGLALSVECDQRPLEAVAKLKQILGRPTVVVASGGKWTDPASGQVHDKLHLHWRLRPPARGEDVARLKQARDLAARLVGADRSNIPPCHPIRWPGSWHRKAEPVMCRIEEANLDSEIDLASALAVLTAACPPPDPQQQANGKDHPAGTSPGWSEQIHGIISGNDYHGALVSLAAKILHSGMGDGAAVNLLRGLMDNSKGPRDARWQARYNDILRAVSTAREKIGEGPRADARNDRDASPPPPPPKPSWRDGMITARELCTETFQPLKFIVPGILPEGLTILAGRPKIGKSWLVLLLGVVLSNGVAALGLDYGMTPPLKGDVLYLGLEDGKRRLHRRMTKLVGTKNWPERLHLKTDWRRLDQGGIEDIRNWHKWVKDRGGNPIMVIIDTMAKVRAPGSSKNSPYQNDHDALGNLQKLATELGIAIIVNHHDRKMDAEDVFDTVSGTLGLTGAVDTIIVLTKKAGITTLHVRGRDLDDDAAYAMRFNKTDCRWSVTGDAAEVQRSSERTRILGALACVDDGLAVPEIMAAAQLGSRNNADQMLARMNKDGEIERLKRGVYGLPGTREKIAAKIEAKIAAKTGAKAKLLTPKNPGQIGQIVRSDDKALKLQQDADLSDNLTDLTGDMGCQKPGAPLSEVSESPKAHRSPPNTGTSASDATSDTPLARCPIRGSPPETPDRARDLDIPEFLDRRNGRQPDWLKPRVGPPAISAGPDDDELAGLK
jgi:hypothetical protein